jgi:hypothetical protein
MSTVPLSCQKPEHVRKIHDAQLSASFEAERYYSMVMLFVIHDKIADTVGLNNFNEPLS